MTLTEIEPLDLPPPTTEPTDRHRSNIERARLIAHRRRRQSLLAPFLVAVPLLTWFAIQPDRAPAPPLAAAGPSAAVLYARIDPNTAPWWELAAAPRIGETMARRIVAYRDEQQAATGHRRVFRRPEDLEQVHGIGPKTVERLRPLLKFDSETTP